MALPAVRVLRCRQYGQLADKPYCVAFAVPDKGHPFVRSCGPQQPIGVAEDDMGFCHHLDSPAFELFHGLPHIGNFEIEKRPRCSPFQQQPQAIKIEEQQPGRVKHGRGLDGKQLGIERRRPLEVAGVLSYLNQPHGPCLPDTLELSILLNRGGADKGQGSHWQGALPAGQRGQPRIARLEIMTPPIQQPVQIHSRRRIAAAAITDAVLILVFAAVGRDAHQRGDVVAGVFLTAWPFLAGAALGWVASRAWRHPLSVRRAGLAVWLGALAGGMALRLLTNQTVVLPFIIVALLSLGLLLVGWRLAWAGIRRLRKT
jgi:hypothetical protein